jgi:hypothetical protein
MVRFRRLRVSRTDHLAAVFPSSSTIASLLSTLAVFGAGFLMRPVGSILFGIMAIDTAAARR